MRWEQLTVCVKAKKANGRNAIGTGFPVGRGLLLTARHVVRPEGAAGSVVVRWWHSRAEGFRPEDDEAKGGFVPAKIVWESDELDVALLSAAHPPDIGAIRLTSAAHALGPCTCEAFPTGARVDKQTKTIRINGLMNTVDGSGEFFQIDLAGNPHKLADWGGLSGAPVIDNSAAQAVGVYVVARSALDANRFANAIPGSRIWRAPGFAAELGQVWRTHEPDEIWKSTHLSVSQKRLADRLAALATDERRALLKHCGFRNAKELVSDVDQAARELIQDCRAAVDRVRDYQKTVEDRDPVVADQLRQVAWSIAALDLDDNELRLVSYLVQERDNTAALPLGGPVGTLTLLELIAAAVDRGRPRFIPRHAETELPRGEKCLPFVTPESGPDGDDVSAFIQDLRARIGISNTPASGLFGEVERRLQDELGPVRVSARPIEDLLDEPASRPLRQALNRRRKDGERSYYVPFVPPTDPDNADRLRDGITRLRERYREILAIGLDPNLDRVDQEEERLGRLISTVPILTERR